MKIRAAFFRMMRNCGASVGAGCLGETISRTSVRPPMKVPGLQCRRRDAQPITHNAAVLT
jgi:hypothetical protein